MPRFRGKPIPQPIPHRRILERERGRPIHAAPVSHPSLSLLLGLRVVPTRTGRPVRSAGPSGPTPTARTRPAATAPTAGTCPTTTTATATAGACPRIAGFRRHVRPLFRQGTPPIENCPPPRRGRYTRCNSQAPKVGPKIRYLAKLQVVSSYRRKPRGPWRPMPVIDPFERLD